MNIPKPSCIQIHDPLFTTAGIDLKLWKLGEAQPGVGGNKSYKLKYNIEAFRKSGLRAILTTGGAYSNHIAATAAAGAAYGFPTIGIIRGDASEILNPTLLLARERGMEIRFMDRETYRDKKLLMLWIREHFGEENYIIPEGGSNEAGLKGCMEILDDLEWEPDLICCACGTGTTLAGIASGVKGRRKTMGFPALKAAGFMQETLAGLAGREVSGEVMLIHDYHFGGYAKHTPELIEFMASFNLKQGFELDFIYTAKMMWGIYDLTRKGYFKKGQKILAVHTGGLQGNSSLL